MSSLTLSQVDKQSQSENRICNEMLGVAGLLTLGIPGPCPMLPPTARTGKLETSLLSLPCCWCGQAK